MTTPRQRERCRCDGKTPAYQLKPWVRCYDPMRGCAHLRGAERCVSKHGCSQDLQVIMKAKRRAAK